MTLRRGKLVLAVLGALVCAAAAIALPVASAGAKDIEDAFVSLALEGTNGYTVTVLGAPEVDEPVKPGGERKGNAIVYVKRKSATVLYVTRARLTAEFIEGIATVTSFRANLGELGRIDVAFKPTGGVKVARPHCREASISYVGGNYEGSIEFHGEQDYTDVSATAAPQRPEGLLRFACADRGVIENKGPRARGAKLEAVKLSLRGNDLDAVELQANKNRPGAKAHIVAASLEEAGPMEIFRTVEIDAPANAFTFDRRLRRARVSPGSPFRGRAVYRRGGKHSNSSWRGNLTVDLPGRANVHLATHGFIVGLKHATRHVLPHGVEARRARLMRSFLP